MTTQESSTTNELSINDDLPTDLQDVEAWAAKVSKGDTGTDANADAEAQAQAEARAAADAEAKAQAEAEAEAEAAAAAKTEGAAPGTEGQVDGILAKDGKNFLPFGVLEAERKRSREAAEAAAAAKARAEALEKELEALRKGGDATQNNADETDALIADIESQLEGVPEVAAPMKLLAERLRDMSKQVADLRAQREDDDRRGAAKSEEDVLTTVQAAIDTTPALLYWQNEDPEMFERAIEFDARFKADPKLQGLSLGDRFRKVVGAMEATYGPANVPAKYLPPAPREQQTEQPKVTTETKPAAQVNEQPMTLSDLPGGLPPEKNDKRFEQMTIGESERYIDNLVAKGMDPQSLAQHLAAGYAIG